jgi:NAD(P)-dependent dehydrogenase (short-subunit alcohol dehydrogenase family)
VFFVPSRNDEQALPGAVAEIRRTVARKVGVAPEFVIPVTIGDIPKTSLGKIQRSELRQRFEAGEFAASRRLVRLEGSGDEAVPDWFYKPIWRPRQLRASETGRLPRLVVLCDDESALAASLRAKLLEAGVRVVTVTAGKNFEAKGSDRYRARPENATDLEKLLSEVLTPPSQDCAIAYLWDFSAREVPERSEARAARLLAIVRALAGDVPSTTLRLLVATANGRAVLAHDAIDLGAHVTAALVKTVPQELSGVTAVQVDVDPSDLDIAVQALLAELCSSAAERDVAYRAGRRFVSRLERVAARTSDRVVTPFKKDGFYVITGGLGGIGFEVARFLRAQYGARLLLIGRRSLDAIDEGVEQAGQRLRELDGGQSEVRYEALDVADATNLRVTIAAAERRFGRRVDAALHLAGTFSERLLADETDASLSAQLAVKIRGAVALHDALADNPDAAMVTFSSVTGYFGGFAVAAYAAGNAFLDAFAYWQRTQGRPRSYSIAWSLWEGTGMARSYELQDRARARGHLPVSVASGLSSLRIALSQSEPLMLVGLDVNAGPVRRWLEEPCEALHEVVVHIDDSQDLARFSSLRAVDRFGRLVPCAIEKSVVGGPGSAAADGRGPSASGAVHAAPRNELEQRIAMIWQDVLRDDQIDVFANFFDVGGTSLLMAQVYRRLKDVVGGSLSMTDLFAAPSISALAARIASDSEPAGANGAEQRRGEERREKIKRLKGRGATRRPGP